MKCPKCGFNSFEYYDSCKKCLNDLTGYKQSFSIGSVVLPGEARGRLEAEYRKAETPTEQSVSVSEAHNDIFSFDLPDKVATPPSDSERDPFSFDEPSSVTLQSTGDSSDDVFAGILETTVQAEKTVFADTGVFAKPASITDNAADAPSEHGELDLESFSWDDLPTEASPTATPDDDISANDFDSLFGETKDTTPK